MVFPVQGQGTPALPADRHPPSDLSELLRYFVRFSPVAPLWLQGNITSNQAIPQDEDPAGHPESGADPYLQGSYRRGVHRAGGRGAVRRAPPPRAGGSGAWGPTAAAGGSAGLRA